MGRYLKESGRLRYTEKSFNVEMGGARADACAHGWYRQERRGREVCVKCGEPKDACEAELTRRAAVAQAVAAIDRARAAIDRCSCEPEPYLGPRPYCFQHNHATCEVSVRPSYWRPTRSETVLAVARLEPDAELIELAHGED